MRFLRTSACLAFALAGAVASAEDLSQKVDPWVLARVSEGDAEFLVMLRQQADLRGARSLRDKVERRAFVQDSLESLAERAQAPLREWLAQRRIPHRSFWIANMIWVRGGRSVVEELASRADVSHIYANPSAHFDAPVARDPDSPSAPATVEWGVSKIHAPDVWALGFTGQGVVVAGADTGYEWDHSALKPHYRGWSGSAAEHDYNWHDAIHSGGGVCGADSPAPCDDNGHGTHTMGTMVGDDGGGNQIGVAPGAKWIGCRNMDQGSGTPATYAECLQFFIAPTDIQNQNPDPSKAPDVVSNSWSCPSSEGCTDPAVLQAIVESTRAAGIEVVAAAGNSGPGCSTVAAPPAIYDAAFSVGATDISDVLAGFSSRGPVTVDGSNRLKPDVSAPGVNVRSSIPGNTYAIFSGTSMASPHVAGLIALFLSTHTELAGDPDAIEPFIISTAVPVTVNPAQTCGGIPSTAIPNNSFGWGRVDALAAVCAANPAPFQIVVDSAGNGVWEPGEAVDVGPSYANYCTATIPILTGTATNLTGPAGGIYTIEDAAAAYGTAPPGVLVSCFDTSNCYGVSVTNPSPRPASHWDASLEETLSEGPIVTWTLHIGESFTDTPTSNPFYAFIENIFHNGVTGGCAGGGYCPGNATFRKQMAVFALKSKEGTTYAPPAATGVFSDVPPSNPFAPWIEELFRRGVVAGCGGGAYCPDDPVLRQQMAVFLLKTLLGSSYVPPPCAGLFADVPCSNPFAPWIEDLFNRSIAAGCGGNNFCPTNPTTRGQMAPFLVKTFGLLLYRP